MTRLAIIDYGSGNVRSVQRALEAAANHFEIPLTVTLTDDPDRIRQADRIVLPGVGHFADCAAGLASRNGVTEALNEAVFRSRRPFLGVCVGMQLMADVGREDVETRGLGWISGAVERIKPKDAAGMDLPVPHMGWSQLHGLADDPLLEGVGEGDYAYFVHSYVCPDTEATIACAAYGAEVPAMVRSGNRWGCQFHPERSAKAGARILKNFLELAA